MNLASRFSTVARCFGVALFCTCAAQAMPPTNGGKVRLTFDANNPVTDVTFYAQRRLKEKTWLESADTVVEGRGTPVDKTIRSSGGVTATRAGNTVQTSEDFFVPEDEGKFIHWTGGIADDRIIRVINPRLAITTGSGVVAAGPFELETDRVELIDDNVPTGIYVYRVAARSHTGESSTFSNEADIQLALLTQPENTQLARAEDKAIAEVEIAVLNFRMLATAVVFRRSDGTHEIHWS